MKRVRFARQTDDPGFSRVLGRLLTDLHTTPIPSAHALDQASIVTPDDITAAVRLWDEAQRAAGTGLEGALA